MTDGSIQTLRNSKAQAEAVEPPPERSVNTHPQVGWSEFSRQQRRKSKTPQCDIHQPNNRVQGPVTAGFVGQVSYSSLDRQNLKVLLHDKFNKLILLTIY
jgi:hypothetical protein